MSISRGEFEKHGAESPITDGESMRIVSALALGCLTVLACRPRSDRVAALGPVTKFAPGVVSTGSEFGETFTPDGQTVVFTRFTPPHMILMTSTLTAGRWNTPESLPFSGTYRDLDPSFSPDGRRLYFASWRPVRSTIGDTLNQSDLWYAERTSSGWGKPVHLGPVSSAAMDYGPGVVSSGTIYFDSFRSGRRMIWRAAADGKGGFLPPALLDGVINGDSGASNAFVDPQERYLLFAAERPGGAGGSDLYLSWRQDTAWSAPVPLGPSVNTAAEEFAPFVSRDGQTLYFTRVVRTGNSADRNIFFVPIASLLTDGH